MLPLSTTKTSRDLILHFELFCVAVEWLGSRIRDTASQRTFVRRNLTLQLPAVRDFIEAVHYEAGMADAHPKKVVLPSLPVFKLCHTQRVVSTSIPQYSAMVLPCVHAYDPESQAESPIKKVNRGVRSGKACRPSYCNRNFEKSI